MSVALKSSANCALYWSVKKKTKTRRMAVREKDTKSVGITSGEKDTKSVGITSRKKDTKSVGITSREKTARPKECMHTLTEQHHVVNHVKRLWWAPPESQQSLQWVQVTDILSRSQQGAASHLVTVCSHLVSLVSQRDVCFHNVCSHLVSLVSQRDVSSHTACSHLVSLVSQRDVCSHIVCSHLVTTVSQQECVPTVSVLTTRMCACL